MEVSEPLQFPAHNFKQINKLINGLLEPSEADRYPRSDHLYKRLKQAHRGLRIRRIKL